MVAPVEILVKANTKSLDGLGKALKGVEKQVGSLNKVKITLDTTEAEREIEKLNDQLKRADKFVDQFLGRTNAARRGVGAFDNTLSKLKGQLALVRKGFENTNNEIKRQERGVALLAGQYKKMMIEGRALAEGAAGGKGFFGLFGGEDDARAGIGSLKNRIKELEKLPKSMAGTSQALREVRFLLDYAVDGSEEFNLLVRAQNSALERQKQIYADIARITRTQAREQRMAALPQAVPTTQFAGPIGPGQARLLTQRPISRAQAPSVPVARAAAPRATRAPKKVPFTQSALGQAALGGGFPALFGAGPVSVAGGAIGGLMGGFAGGIVGSLIGQQVDAFVGAAGRFADSLRKPTENLDQIVKSIGRVNTELETNSSVLKNLGLESVAAKAAFEDLTDLVGKDGVASLERLSDSWNNMLNQFNRLFVLIAAGSTGVLAPLLDTLAAIVGATGGTSTSGEGRSAKVKRLQSDVDALTAAGIKGAPLNLAREQLKAAQEQKEARTPDAGRIDIEKIISEEYERQLDLAKQATDLERMQLTARRDDLATSKGALTIQGLKNELTKIDLALNGKLEESKKRQLEADKQQTEEKIRAAKAAQANARALAAREIRREVDQSLIRQFELNKSINGEILKEIEFTEGVNAAAAKQLDYLANHLFIDEEIAALREKMQLEGKNEIEIQKELTKQFGMEAALRGRIYSNEVLITRERRAQARLAVAETQQQRDLQLMQMQGQFSAQIAEAGAFPVGPFAEGALSAQLRDMERMNEIQQRSVEIQNKQLNLRMEGADLRADERAAREAEIAYLERALGQYQTNSLELNELISFQERYRETLALTKPVTDSLYDSLMAVSAGTQTAQEAFANFLRAIANMLSDVAKQMIATYIAIGIARLFAGMPSSAGNTPAPDVQSGEAFNLPGMILTGGMRTAASGKGAIMNQPYLVGERGPELFVPRGNGTIVPNHETGMGSNIVVNVDATGSNVEGDADRSNQLGKAIGLAVQQELVKQKRPGGLLAGT